ncbi:hypothetical protein [Dysgonomonas sp. ZJ709]|uniref:hypothetical protein n=1 Tax=Dysgonomonas sp. ZJ709 TaxID=2709797 RepID=UPI0021056DA8|nr:hypothetical protein [Dysgonomonas sp. ZJ709]
MKKEYYRLKLKHETIDNKIKSLIINAIQENGGRISFQPTDDDDDYPLAILLLKKDVSFISITEGIIRVDGIDDDTQGIRKEFKIGEEEYDNILYFIGYVLRWFDGRSRQQVIDDTNTSIMELSCALAEKEMSDKHGMLPEKFMDVCGENYTEDFQDEFNPLYDKYYARISELADFEYK